MIRDFVTYSGDAQAQSCKPNPNGVCLVEACNQQSSGETYLVMRPSFDELASQYDRTRGLLPNKAANEIVNTILRLTAAGPDTKFLEPGIGTGRLAVPLITRDLSYTGLDTSRRMMSEVLRKVQGLNVRLSLVQADITAMPFKDDTFDVVLTSQVLYLVPDWLIALAEIKRVLTQVGLYLFCHEQTERSTIADLIDERWFYILQEHGYAGAWQSSVSDTEILKTIRGQHGHVSSTAVTEWEYQVAVTDYLDNYNTRARKLYPQLLDQTFADLAHQLRTWTMNQVNSGSHTIFTRTQFVVNVISAWKNK